MPYASRWTRYAERTCLAILFAWLVWLPLPFGSIVERARLPLVAVPLAVCIAAAAIRLWATRDRGNTAQPTRAWLIWGNGALLFLLVASLQLVPLPQSLLQLASPESHAIWSRAARVAALAGVSVSSAHPISVDPQATAFELFRLAAMLAAFVAAALMIRSHSRRMVLASVLCVAAAFEAMYGMREAALQRYEIWGWVNKLIFNRVTGTFVNPNHFAHYVAIVLPMALFLIAVAWHLTGNDEVPAAQRFLRLIEHHLLRTAVGLLAAVACVAAILLAQSRGAFLAVTVTLLALAAMLPGRRLARIALGSAAGLVLVTALVLFLGPDRTVRRFVPSEAEQVTLIGRRIGISAAIGIWQRFSIFGSGVGTFDRVVSLEQQRDPDKIYHHAHNDYVEIAATSGTLGFTIAMVTLIAGYVALVRTTFGAAARELTWRRRAFQAAALTSLTIAMVHALLDFNFFIPSNPATLATILGAAVATVDHDRKPERRRPGG
ncbi:MAG TPA: O-antigen ligase family protein [Thermoanaerobaculia bacterium]|nr:O-antigen ligase family protein [Thermoanaerobaculia bacterium]